LLSFLTACISPFDNGLFCVMLSQLFETSGPFFSSSHRFSAIAHADPRSDHVGPPTRPKISSHFCRNGGAIFPLPPGLMSRFVLSHLLLFLISLNRVGFCQPWLFSPLRRCFAFSNSREFFFNYPRFLNVSPCFHDLQFSSTFPDFTLRLFKHVSHRKQSFFLVKPSPVCVSLFSLDEWSNITRLFLS